MKLPKSARMHHRSLQERLFRDGSTMHEFPLRLTWNSLTHDELASNFRNRVPQLIGPVQVLVSVPKKKRRKAVDRVLLRRRIREAFRLNRGVLLEFLKTMPQIRTLGMAFIYMKEGNADYAVIEEKLKKLLERLPEKIEEKYRKETEEIIVEEDSPEQQ